MKDETISSRLSEGPRREVGWHPRVSKLARVRFGWSILHSAACLVMLLFGFLTWSGAVAVAQNPIANVQTWQTIDIDFDLRAKTRLQLSQELDAADSYRKWTSGALLSYRVKRLLRSRPHDPDEENQHIVVLGVGYEHARTSQNGKLKNENRIVAESTGRLTPGAHFLLTDRNRSEFRWVNGVYDFRYRNKVTIDHPFKSGNFRFLPYASGELFWDRNHHAWDENHYSFGVQLPYRKLLMLDLYYRHQNCTTCSPHAANIFGLTLNVFARTVTK